MNRVILLAGALKCTGTRNVEEGPVEEEQRCEACDRFRCRLFVLESAGRGAVRADAFV